MIFLGYGIVWDKENKQRLCKFENGVFETEDDRTIKILLENGYKTENGNEIVINDANEVVVSDAVEVEIKLEDMDLDELFEVCKERHYKGCYTIKTKEKLLDFIARKEGE